MKPSTKTKVVNPFAALDVAVIMHDAAVTFATGCDIAGKILNLTEQAKVAKDKFSAYAKEIRRRKVTLGKSRATCPHAKAVFAAFLESGVSERTATNYLAEFRKAINGTGTFRKNSSARKPRGKTDQAGKGAPANATPIPPTSKTTRDGTRTVIKSGITLAVEKGVNASQFLGVVRDVAHGRESGADGPDWALIVAALDDASAALLAAHASKKAA